MEVNFELMEVEAEVLAIHEAGHCVIATILGIDVENATITSNGKSNAITYVGMQYESMRDHFTNVLILLAGVLAEEKAGYDHSWANLGLWIPSQNPDETWVEPKTTESDGGQIWRVNLPRLSSDVDVQLTLFREAFSRVEALIHNPAIQQAVENVANGLMQRTTLLGDEIRELVNAALEGSEWQLSTRDLAREEILEKPSALKCTEVEYIYSHDFLAAMAAGGH